MKYFDIYSSNTVAGTSNQRFFLSDNNEHCGRIFYKISHGGTFNYSLLFSNIIDSTFADGSISHKNFVCDSWELVSAKIANAGSDFFGSPFDPALAAESVNKASLDFKTVTFDGNTSKSVAPGEFFSTDPLLLSFEKGDYLCLEITFCGKMLPQHEEAIIPAFLKNDSGWTFSTQMPFASMVGCDRKVKSRIACIGDSITQGIGVATNSYAHWNALVAEKLPEDFSLWNLGIGFARADDMASDGAWAFKAKQSDIVFVCYGVNDLFNGFNEEQIKSNLTKIVDMMKSLGKKVLIQTLPPFDYPPEIAITWKNVNDYIMTELSKKADLAFDDVPYLCESEENPHMSKYEPHPNEIGTVLWANALYAAISESDLLN